MFVFIGHAENCWDLKMLRFGKPKIQSHGKPGAGLVRALNFLRQQRAKKEISFVLRSAYMYPFIYMPTNRDNFYSKSTKTPPIHLICA